MKKTILITLLTLLSAVCFAQSGGPLKFLGIPIDGSESQFVAKLKTKGFTYSGVTKGYKGQFNGMTVDVYIHTNHNLVDRVYVSFPYTNEDGIRTEFNRLLGQFKNNGKYQELDVNEEISLNDDISYEIIVKNKRYQASFCYYDDDCDRISFMFALIDKFSDFFTEEQSTKLKQYAVKALGAQKDQQDALRVEMMKEMQTMGLGRESDAEADPEKPIKFLATFMDGMRSLADGNVWFMIHEHYGQYQIGLYYDNLHNQSHGEDL